MRKESVFEQAQKEIARLENIRNVMQEHGIEIEELPFRKTKRGKEKKRYTRKELERLRGITAKDILHFASDDFGIWNTIIDNFIYGNDWVHLTDIGKAKLAQWFRTKVDIFGAKTVADVLQEAKSDGTAFYLKQNSYDWDVMEKIVGEYGLESYFSDKYTLEEQREEALREAEELQKEYDNTEPEWDYENDELPFNF